MNAQQQRQQNYQTALVIIMQIGVIIILIGSCVSCLGYLILAWVFL